MPRISYDDAVDGKVGRLTREDAARYLGLEPKTLAEYARLGSGPPFHKMGGRTFYYVSDLITYIRKSEKVIPI